MNIPYIVQEDPAWCGVACSEMVAQYFNWSYQYYWYWIYQDAINVNNGLQKDRDAQYYTARMVQVNQSTAATGNGVAEGMDGSNGIQFLAPFDAISDRFGHDIGDNSIDPANWGWRQVFSANDMFDFVRSSIDGSCPMILRVNTIYLRANGWTDGLPNTHYILAYGYANFKVQDSNNASAYNNGDARVQYADPYYGYGHATYFSDLYDGFGPGFYITPGGFPGGTNQDISITTLTNAMDGTALVPGYFIFNNSAIPGLTPRGIVSNILARVNATQAQRVAALADVTLGRGGANSRVETAPVTINAASLKWKKTPILHFKK